MRLRRRPGLATRMALATTAVALLAVVVAGALTAGLLRDTAVTASKRTLGREAALIAQLSERPAATPAQRRTVARLLVSQRITIVRIDAQGAVDRALTRPIRPAAGFAPATLAPSEVSTLLAGRAVDRTRTVGGVRAIVEGRPLDDGGAIALLQPVSQARELSTPVRDRLAVGLLVGLAAAALAGILLARWLARPLRGAARAAHRLAAGRRDVRLDPTGPAELADLAEAMNTLAAALQSSEAGNREFLLSVSHELRTPLTAVRGFAEALADSVTPPGEVARTGRIVLDEAERLDRLVCDLLDLARLGADDFRVDPAPVDLRALMIAAGEVWGARCRAEGVRFALDLPSGQVMVMTDGVRVRQIIDGLAENALRVVPAGAPIVFALTVAPPWAVLAVRDGGPGLTEADQAVAFDRSVLYERYRGIRRVGTGVGLALVAGLADRLGGVAVAGDAPEGGAAFAVRLPLPGPPGAGSGAGWGVTWGAGSDAGWDAGPPPI
ncbi:MAG: sensor histidine kinase [Frankia sp.]